MQIIPAVDVLDGSVVRLLHGRYDDVTVYASDPVKTASGWINEGASLVHVVDLNGARTGEPDSRLWRVLGKSEIAFQIGGGIRDHVTAGRAVEAGAERVVVGTIAVHDDRVLGEIVKAIGSERVVAAIDVRDDRARGAGWTDIGVPLRDVVRKVVDSGVRIALVTGIERDGAMSGPNLDLLTKVQTIAPTLELIASGGIDSLHSIAALGLLRCDGAIIGRALYEGSLTLPDAITAASNESRNIT
jgi:phosphoribosylformimino-5-aminoimidazole carboxamide ribotide isomerase